MQPAPVPISGGSYVSMRAKWIQAIHSPLGFCALALLIVETFLLGTGIWFDLPLEWRLASMGVGVMLFLIVFGSVLWLIVKHPKNLVFSEESHVQVEAMRLFGTEAHVITGRDLRALQPQASPVPPVGQPADVEEH